jgi:hypothetical protein
MQLDHLTRHKRVSEVLTTTSCLLGGSGTDSGHKACLVGRRTFARDLLAPGIVAPTPMFGRIAPGLREAPGATRRQCRAVYLFGGSSLRWSCTVTARVVGYQHRVPS